MDKVKRFIIILSKKSDSITVIDTEKFMSIYNLISSGNEDLQKARRAFESSYHVLVSDLTSSANKKFEDYITNTANRRNRSGEVIVYDGSKNYGFNVKSTNSPAGVDYVKISITPYIEDRKERYLIPTFEGFEHYALSDKNKSHNIDVSARPQTATAHDEGEHF